MQPNKMKAPRRRAPRLGAGLSATKIPIKVKAKAQGKAAATRPGAREFAAAMVEQSPGNIVYTDADFVIRYVNPASQRALVGLEPLLPVKVGAVVGSSIDIFFQEPEAHRRMLADPRSFPYRARIALGPETLDLVVSVITDGGRHVAGFMLTWEVLTRQVAQERAANELLEAGRRQAAALTHQVESMLASVEAAAQGDLTRSVEVDGTGVVAKMATGLRSLLDHLRESIGSIGQHAQQLASASEQVNGVSHQMTANAEETSAQANLVTAASEQVNRNVQTVASATEQMSASIREIAKSANEAARVATTAVRVAETTNATVAKLGESSGEIGKVIKVITLIAQQTNLLALNATIEAARAGEAGKGFAVVANEVKELAKETAKATEDIGQKIEAIQSDTKGAVQAIAQITNIIGQINDIQHQIASAVEEQTATTNEIGRNIAEAARGSSDITRNITGVAQAAQSTSAGANDTQRAASELSAMAVELQRLVARFRV